MRFRVLWGASRRFGMLRGASGCFGVLWGASARASGCFGPRSGVLQRASGASGCFQSLRIASGCFGAYPYGRVLEPSGPARVLYILGWLSLYLDYFAGRVSSGTLGAGVKH